MPITIHRGELDLPDVQALLAHHVAEMRAATPAEHCHVMPGDALRAPDITFLSARDENGALLGIGALKRISEREGELKSMRVAPTALGRGIGRALLEALTAEARRQGFTRLRLETGTVPLFGPATALYRSAGFVEVPAFEGYPDEGWNLFLAKAM